VALLQWAFVWVIFPLLYLVACSGRSLEAWSCWAYPCTRSLSSSCCCYCCRSASSLGCRPGGTALESPLPHCVDQGRSQLKTNPGAPSIKYKGICTILKEIHGNFEVHISNFSFYRGARAPGKANVASPLTSGALILTRGSVVLSVPNINLRSKMFLLIYYFFVSYSILADHSPVQSSSICNGVKA